MVKEFAKVDVYALYRRCPLPLTGATDAMCNSVFFFAFAYFTSHNANNALTIVREWKG